MDTIAQRLKYLRLRKWVYAKDVAEFTGIHKQTVYNIEEGTFLPSIDSLVRLSKFYKVSIDWIVLGKENDLYEKKFNEIRKLCEL